jgi:5-methylcytosine-specific restriction endonuclease McrA
MERRMEDGDQLCVLCSRPLGTRSEAHHLVPKSKGGRETVRIHAICHRKIHRVFTNQELTRLNGDIDALRAHPEISKFIRWVARKPADFHAPTR